MRRDWRKGWLLCCCSIGTKAKSSAIFCALHTTRRTVAAPGTLRGYLLCLLMLLVAQHRQEQLGSGNELQQPIQSRHSTPLLSVHSSSNKPTLMRCSSRTNQQQCPTGAAQNTEK